MIVNGVSMPRSGTMSMVKFLQGFGIPSLHEGKSRVSASSINFLGWLPYDVDNWPIWIDEWLERMELHGHHGYMHSGRHFFHSAWGRSVVMYPLECKYPHLRFIITIRDIKEVCNSWFHKNWRLIKHKAKPGAKKPDINKRYAEVWKRVHESFIEQAKRMQHKPLVMRFEDYISGKHIETFFNIFDIPKTKDNFRKAENILQTKVNTFGAYEMLPLEPERIEGAKLLQEELETICKDNWYSETWK